MAQRAERPAERPPGQASRAEASRAWVRALDAIRILDERPGLVLPALFAELAETFADNVALFDAHEELTYRQLAGRASRYARWARTQGLAPGAVVALLMPNCPEYVAVWFGLTRVGCAVALINTNLTGAALLHSLAAAGATQVIVAEALRGAIEDVRAALAPDTRCWVHGAPEGIPEESADGMVRIEPALAALSDAPLASEEERLPLPRDRALLIYTSGTTGLPKAANVSHGRIMEWSHWFAGMMDATAQDRLYDCLPMYHSVGGVVAVGAMLVRGGAVMIRPRFSASRFWDDVADGGCTIFQYIGELCRYLDNSAPHPRERQHRLRLCCGNGLRGDVWERFQARFAIPRILEYYAATEGSVSLYNVEGKPGAIGRVPPFLAARFPLALIRVDADTAEPVRGADGLCLAAGIDEPGEALGRLTRQEHAPARHFDGYTDPAASARKVLHDVFEPGDTWFRTGDLMRRDKAGYYYFLDRLGDTFRWKGENCSTTEVASVVATCPGVTDAVVYGVAVPHQDGRAGMAAITVAPDFAFAALYAHVAARLPDYARPLFVRVVGEFATTGTFKPVKAELVREGFEGEGVWFRDEAAGAYVELDKALRARIAAGGRV